MSISLKNETYSSIVSRLIILTFLSSACKEDETKLGGHASLPLYIEAKLLDSYIGGKYQPLDIMLGNHPSMGVILDTLSLSF